MNVEISFGALAQTINNQLDLQSLTADANQVRLWEEQRRAIVALHIHSLLTDGEALKARQRLLKKIAANIRALKKEAKDD